jgi:peptidoglycan/LPS O-acetylase OafA/YrhL
VLLQAWVPSQDIYFGLNTPSWSLSCEAFFYLCFPLLLRGLDRMSDRALWPAAVCLAGAVWCMPLVTLGWSGSLAYWFIYVFPVTRMLEFCLGMVLARIVRRGQWIGVPVWAAGLLLIGVYAVVGYLPDTVGYVAATVVPLALLIPAVATADVAGRATIWRRPAMVRLGELSFAFYLVHQLAIRYAAKLLGSPPPTGWPVARAAGTAVAMGLAALAGSWLLYRYVEQPLMRRLSKSRPRPVTAAPLTTVVEPSGLPGS